MTESSPLPLHCPHCGGALLVEVEIGGPAATPGLWACPYCHKPLDVDVGGRIVWVTKPEDADEGLSRH